MVDSKENYKFDLGVKGSKQVQRRRFFLVSFLQVWLTGKDHCFTWLPLKILKILHSYGQSHGVINGSWTSSDSRYKLMIILVTIAQAVFSRLHTLDSCSKFCLSSMQYVKVNPQQDKVLEGLFIPWCENCDNKSILQVGIFW